MKKILLTQCLIVIYCNVSFSQDFTLYTLSNMQQRFYVNPAFVPESNVQIGFPLLSSLSFHLSNSGFKYSDLIFPQGDSLVVDFANALSKLNAKNNLLFQNNIELFTAGFKIKKNYFHLGVREQIMTQLNYPKGFFQFLWEGNAPSAGEELQFGFALNMMHYREFSLGYSRQVTEKLQVGGQFKLLKGMSNIHTELSDISILTNPDSAYDITLSSSILINSSGLFSSDTSTSLPYNISGKGNSGFAIDLGATYQLNDNIQLSASVINLGSISWTHHVKNFASSQEKTSYTYNGLPLGVFFDGDSAFDKAIEQLTDSIEALLQFDTTSNSYKTSLPTEIRFGGEYKITENQRAGGVLLLRPYQQTMLSGVSLYFSSKVGKWLHASVSYNYFNNAWTNIGVGFRINGGAFQFHALTDNVLGIMLPQHAKFVNVRTGFNFTFGGGPKKKVSLSE